MISKLSSNMVSVDPYLSPLVALLANLPESEVAVGTGFGQLFRGLGNA